MSKDLEKYPKTEMFSIIDTIGVPHPYMITDKHVSYCADNWNGMLGKECILEGEKLKKCKCGWKNCALTYEEHEQALVVECITEQEISEIQEDLHAYLLSVKDMAIADGYAGFSFIQG